MAKSGIKQRDGIPAPVVWGTIILVLLLVIWLGFQSMGPDSQTRQGIQNLDYLTDMARKSRGDMSNLSASEQAEVRKIAGQDAESALGNLYSQMPQESDVELPPRGR